MNLNELQRLTVEDMEKMTYDEIDKAIKECDKQIEVMEWNGAKSIAPTTYALNQQSLPIIKNKRRMLKTLNAYISEEKRKRDEWERGRPQREAAAARKQAELDEWHRKWVAKMRTGKFLSIASLVLGLVSLVLVWNAIIKLALAGTGLIFGIIAYKKYYDNIGTGVSTAGRVLSIISLFVSVLVVVAFGLY